MPEQEPMLWALHQVKNQSDVVQQCCTTAAGRCWSC